MELFYTVASREGVAQSKPELSLGGFCSSSKVPNAALDNLFGEVSAYSLQKPRTEYVGIILKNTIKPVSSLRFWMEVAQGTLCKYRLSVVELSDDGQMELIPSQNSKPLYAEFYETSPSDPITLSFTEPFVVGDKLGIWIERSINRESEEYTKRNDCDSLYKMFIEGTAWDKEEQVELKIDFEYSE